MKQAENYVLLFKSGSKNQARELAQNMSTSEIQDWENGTTVFIFEDKSAIFMDDIDFRIATKKEVTA